MNYLLIHQAFALPQDAGGTRHYEFACFCAKESHSFTVVASNINYNTGQAVTDGKKIVTEQNVDGIRVLRALTYPSLHRSFVWRIISFLSFMVTSFIAAIGVRHVDLVMGTSPPIFQAVSAWLVAAIRRKPFLLEIRDLWPEFAIDIGVLTNPILIAMSRWLEGFLYDRASHLLVNSPAYRDYLIKKGISPERITLIPNGVSPELFDPSARGESIRQEYELNGQFVVIYAGALGLANDIPTILRAAQRLRENKDIRFLLVGDGKERRNLEIMAKKRMLSNVIFAGAHPKSSMGEYLAASDVCLATLQNIVMFRTTYPNKVFDYMAAGRPIVLAIDGVIREVVDAAQAGVFVTPGDDEAMADTILQLAKDPSRAAAMGRRARYYVVKHFNRADQAALFVNLIVGLASRGQD